MAVQPMNSKIHFSHPNHPLVFHSDDREYTCGACKTSGIGNRFCCHFCNFDLHPYCGDCPDKLPPSIHHHHLTLLLRKPKHSRLTELFCDICRDPIDGLFYRCADCSDFNLHPVCTQLPRHLRHVADPNHSLTLQKPPSATCSLCTKDCSSRWVYGCHICNLNFHLDCVFEPYDSPPARSLSTSRGMPPPWGPGPAPYPSSGYPWNYVGFSGGQFFHPYTNYGAYYGYAAPYSVPDNHFVKQNYGFVHHHESGGGNEAAPSSSSPSSSSSSPTGTKLFGKSMFCLVGRLAIGVLSSVVFGFPVII